MIIAIASGKGGTGKTTLAVNMAAALVRNRAGGQPVRLLDCDVEEPNAHLFLRPHFAAGVSVNVLRPVWHMDRCLACGECARACRYHAIAVVRGRVLFFPELCRSCGACSFVCPQKAITEAPAAIGQVLTADEPAGLAFCQGVLNVGETMAPRLVQAVKSCIRPNEVTLIDAAPGTGCAVAAALRGADVALLVTEPTPFGLNDLRPAVALAARLHLPTAIVVNRSDGEDAIIQQYADLAGLPVVGRVAFRREYAETCSRGELLIERHPELEGEFLAIYGRACASARGQAPALPSEPPLPGGAGPTPDGGPSERAPELVVISGKGGTGKTTVTASLAALLDGLVLADCDVDAADLHLLFAPRTLEEADFVGGQKARILPDACRACGRCAELCRFGAIEAAAVPGGTPARYFVNEHACEGCGLCSLGCPAGAIVLEDSVCGRTYVSHTERGPLSHARLWPGAESSGKLVACVRDRAMALTAEHAAHAVLSDGPPGTGCPVIAAVTNADLALVVTEPTVSGVHDLERVLELTAHFGVRTLVCINKCDLNAEQADRLLAVAAEKGAVVVGRIPFDEEVIASLNAGRVLVDYGTGPAAQAVRRLASRLLGCLRPD